MSEKKKHATTTRTNVASAAQSKRAARTQSTPPWIEGGIDYGPALLAIDELIAWAFDLAAASVADSADGKRRVKNARRFVTSSIRGKRTPAGAEADVMFTASLLVRIFDADLGLGLGDIVSVLSELGLPTVDVPPSPRRPAARATRAPEAAPFIPTAADLAAVIDALQLGAMPAPVVPLRRPHMRVVAPCANCQHGRPGFPVAA